MSSSSPGSTSDGHPTLTAADVTHLARLARLEITATERDVYVDQLSVILDSVAVVSAAAAAEPDIEPTSHAVPLINVYRDDVVRAGLDRDAALAAAPAAQDGRFRVPQILGEEQ
ncbi:Asp-tRNA(Asn)/Glu-tRNA(Gln) amidotransferase subunit GatC [Nakamurella leprariae]|uniref:Asp-tRNA(Asn)/Glu-tRNA(Gln) amidotransferase subunit GatC n=1 Tax=Nakamurella leprariae TaxID=2803911 RepID=UPI002E293492|nr:Asp-tRNA(Asn)/Glu-tRNA(Gln) amidotransferase subunit GatC [Nakamurella leprariae]